jgi:hypothetical protein
MKRDGENNNVALMETEDGTLPESEQEPAEGSVMMVDEVFNENDSQKLNGLQFNLRKKKIVFGGLPHKCNKVIGNPLKKNSLITKLYQCMMVQKKKLVRFGNHLRIPKVHCLFRQIKQRKTLVPATGNPSVRKSVLGH